VWGVCPSGGWGRPAELTIRAEGGIAGIPRETLNLVVLEGLRQLVDSPTSMLRKDETLSPASRY
jgi:hypothetical protein